MLLSETVEGLYHTPLYAFDGTQWVLLNEKGYLAAYDRFISDRAFGQKKRILTTPGNSPLPYIDTYYRAGSPNSDSTFIVESQNPDMDEHGTHLHVYMLREVLFRLQVFAWQEVGKNAAGQTLREFVELPGQHWCDLERYGVVNSTELLIASSSYTLTTSRLVDLPPDCKLVVDLGYRKLSFRITERFDLMNSVQLRLGEWDGDA